MEIQVNGETWTLRQDPFFEDRAEFIKGNDVVSMKPRDIHNQQKIAERFGTTEDQRHEYTSQYRYRLSDTKRGDSLGPCDVCGQHCPQTFIQAEEKYVTSERPDQTIEHMWIHSGTKFGHEECLRSIRK